MTAAPGPREDSEQAALIRPAGAVAKRPYLPPPGMRKGCLCAACWGGIPLVLRHVRNRANCPIHKDIPNGGWIDL